jgi:hypothetical protein
VAAGRRDGTEAADPVVVTDPVEHVDGISRDEDRMAERDVLVPAGEEAQADRLQVCPADHPVPRGVLRAEQVRVRGQAGRAVDAAQQVTARVGLGAAVLPDAEVVDEQHVGPDVHRRCWI